MSRTYKLIFFLSIFVIFYFSVVPASDIPNIAALSFLTDKAIHFLIFLYLSYLGLLCSFPFSRNLLLISIFCFGLLIEIIHFYHPYRYFEISDLIANSIGIFLALMIYSKKDQLSH